MTFTKKEDLLEAMKSIASQVDITSCKTLEEVVEAASLGVRQFRPEIKQIFNAYNAFVKVYNSLPENAENQLSLIASSQSLTDMIAEVVYSLNTDMIKELNAKTINERLSYHTDKVVEAEKTGCIIAIPVQDNVYETLKRLETADIVGVLEGQPDAPENYDMILRSETRTFETEKEIKEFLKPYKIEPEEGQRTVSGVSFETHAQGNIEEVKSEYAPAKAIIAIRSDDKGVPEKNENGTLNAWVMDPKTYTKKYEKPDEKGFSKPAGGIQIFVRLTKDTTVFVPWGTYGIVPQTLKAGAYLNVTNIDDIYGINNTPVVDKETGVIVKSGEFDATYMTLTSSDVLCFDELYDAAIKAGANYMIPEIKAQIDEFAEMVLVPAHQLLMNHNGHLNKEAVALVQNSLSSYMALALEAISAGDWQECKEMLKPHVERINMVIQNAAEKSQEKSKDPAEKTNKPKEAAKPKTKDKNNDDKEM